VIFVPIRSRGDAVGVTTWHDQREDRRHGHVDLRDPIARQARRPVRAGMPLMSCLL
jgi:hypothetical protein